MPKGQGIFDTMRAGVRTDEEVAFSYMFPAKDQFKRLQMMSRHQYRSMTSLSVLGLFRRMFKSKVLGIFQEELNINKISLEGLGRIEGAEILVAKRAAREAEKED
jgi:hypothetical protein